MQLYTQIRNGVSAIWTFGDLTEAGLDDKIPTILQIVNSMRPFLNSNTGVDSSDMDQQNNSNSEVTNDFNAKQQNVFGNGLLT